MRLLDILLLTCCVWSFSSVIAQPKQEDEGNGVTVFSQPISKKDNRKRGGEIGNRKHKRRKYRRPHIERVWIMRSLNDSSSQLSSNFSDPIRSFALAIRDPETFVRYLREEERQRLANNKKQNLTLSDQTIPRSRYVQMEILSQTDSKEKVPILNMIVKQNQDMGTATFMDLVQQVSAIPSYDTWQSNYSNEDTSSQEYDKQQRRQQQQPHQRRQRQQQYRLQQRKVHQSRQQKYQQYIEREQSNNRIEEQIVKEANTKDLAQEDGRIKPELEPEKERREHRPRNTDSKQREHYYRQRVRTNEPLLIMGEFGQRNPNYSRPSTREFNRSKSHDILMAPSVFLLPPTVSNFRHFNLPQNILSFTQTPIPKPRDRNHLRRRKRPKVSVPRYPLDIYNTTANFSSTSSEIPNIVTDNYPLPRADISLVPTDIPRVSNDIPRRLDDISSSESDYSRAHVDLPRIYTGSSQTHIDISSSVVSNSPSPSDDFPPNTDFSRVHIALPRQHIDPHTSEKTVQKAEESSRLDDFSSQLGDPHRPELLSAPTTETYQSTSKSELPEDFQQSAVISPPSTDILPPLLPTFTENPIPYNNIRHSPSNKEENYEDQDYISESSANDRRYPNDVSATNSEKSGVVHQKQSSFESNYSVASNLQQSSDSVTRNTNDNVSSLMTIVVDMHNENGFNFDRNYSASTISNDRHQFGKKTRRRPQQHQINNRIHRERDYNELQLTASETAYYKRRQLARRPILILESTEGQGSIPGVPGRDYPIYNRPPKTNFVCIRGRGGYFVDISTRCQVFYICSEDGHGEPMLCPNGTLFNQDFLVCDWWFNVACEGVL